MRAAASRAVIDCHGASSVDSVGGSLPSLPHGRLTLTTADESSHLSEPPSLAPLPHREAASVSRGGHVHVAHACRQTCVFAARDMGHRTEHAWPSPLSHARRKTSTKAKPPVCSFSRAGRCSGFWVSIPDRTNRVSPGLRQLSTCREKSRRHAAG